MQKVTLFLYTFNHLADAFSHIYLNYIVIATYLLTFPPPTFLK